MPEEGTYSTITSDKNYTGSSNNDYDFITDTSLGWRIWNADDTKITLIADKPVGVGGYKNIGALYLSNCSGYNNSVQILNEVCEKCYSNSEIGAVGRSINIDDIEKTLDKSVWNPEKERIRKEYTENLCYPSIYGVEVYSSIDGIELGEGSGIERSYQTTLCNSSDTYKKANETLSPMQTAWNKSKINSNNFINNNYYYMLFKEGFDVKESLSSYFVASRAVDLSEKYVNFGVFEVSMGKTIGIGNLFNSIGGSSSYWNRIRPMVEIPKENVKIDKTNDGLSKETAFKFEKV